MVNNQQGVPAVARYDGNVDVTSGPPPAYTERATYRQRLAELAALALGGEASTSSTSPLSSQPTTPSQPIVFTGAGGPDECRTFIHSVRRYAFDHGKQADDEWMAAFACTCLVGRALDWQIDLELEGVLGWKSLERLLKEEFITGGNSNSRRERMFWEDREVLESGARQQQQQQRYNQRHHRQQSSDALVGNNALASLGGVYNLLRPAPDIPARTSREPPPGRLVVRSLSRSKRSRQALAGPALTFTGYFKVVKEDSGECVGYISNEGEVPSGCVGGVTLVPSTADAAMVSYSVRGEEPVEDIVFPALPGRPYLYLRTSEVFASYGSPWFDPCMTRGKATSYNTSVLHVVWRMSTPDNTILPEDPRTESRGPLYPYTRVLQGKLVLLFTNGNMSEATRRNVDKVKIMFKPM